MLEAIAWVLVVRKNLSNAQQGRPSEPQGCGTHARAWCERERHDRTAAGQFSHQIVAGMSASRRELITALRSLWRKCTH